MKRNIFLLAGAVTLLFALNSCKDNLDLDKELKFSTQTVEQQKATLEQNGLDLMDKLDGLKSSKAMTAMTFLAGQTSSATVSKPIAQLKANLLRNDMAALQKFNGQMKVLATSSAEEEDVWGTYTWNFTTDEFDFVAKSNKVITMKFPATEEATTNTGELVITYVESSVVAPDTDPVMYMPKSISMVLKVNGSTAMTANFSGSYKSDATPTSVTQTLDIDKYNWKLQCKNDDQDASVKYSFNYSAEVLVKCEVAAAGTLTATSIQNMVSEESEPNTVFNSGAVYFQVMNVAMLGGFKDFDSFYNEMDDLDNSDSKSYCEDQADIFNKYLIMYGYFVKENKKFADVEFYAAGVSEEYYDYATYQYKTRIVYELQPRMILSDGSKVSVEDFMTTGFEDLMAEMENFQEL